MPGLSSDQPLAAAAAPTPRRATAATAATAATSAPPGSHGGASGAVAGAPPEEAAAAIAEKKVDAVAFGTPFLANPDLPARVQSGAELNAPDQATFYTPGAKGYTDYPSL
jgi:2,4-dienoyl-CoA reductase-like NADH-dependent reductase (Old Yellow Enzyme family)